MLTQKVKSSKNKIRILEKKNKESIEIFFIFSEDLTRKHLLLDFAEKEFGLAKPPLKD